MTNKSRTDRRRVFKLGSRVDHVTHHAQQLFKVNRSKVNHQAIKLLSYCMKQEAQLSLSDRAMRLVSSNFASYHATVQKLLMRQVLTKPMV